MFDISVVIPCNHLDLDQERILAWASSLDPENWEIILVVDEMNEDFSEEVSRLEKLEIRPRLKILRGKYGNPGDARNEGLAVVTGRWTTFWDSDDAPNPLATFQMILEAESHKANVAIGSFMLKTDSESSKIQRPSGKHGFCLNSHIVKNPGIWRFCFRTELLSRIKFPSLRMGEDQVFLSQINFSESRVLTSDQVVYGYFSKNPSSLTNNREAVSEIGLPALILSRLVRIRSTNSLGILLLVKMLITVTTSFLRRNLKMSHQDGLTLSRNVLAAVLKSLIYRNSNRLRVIK